MAVDDKLRKQQSSRKKYNVWFKFHVNCSNMLKYFTKPKMSTLNFKANHQIVVEIFQSGPNQPTASRQLAWLHKWNKQKRVIDISSHFISRNSHQDDATLLDCKTTTNTADDHRSWEFMLSANETDSSVNRGEFKYVLVLLSYQRKCPTRTESNCSRVLFWAQIWQKNRERQNIDTKQRRQWETYRWTLG